MTPASTRTLQALLGVAGIVLGVLAYRAQVDNLPEPLTTTGRATATVLAGWSFLVAGLVAWRRRPDNRLGPLMVVAAFALLARQLRYGDSALAFTAFTLFGEVAYVLVGHCALAYPSGRVTDRLERLIRAARRRVKATEGTLRTLTRIVVICCRRVVAGHRPCPVAPCGKCLSPWRENMAKGRFAWQARERPSSGVAPPQDERSVGTAEAEGIG